MNPQNPLTRMLSSSKALVLLVVVIASFTALFLGRATWDQVEGLIKVLVPAWMGAQAIEDGAKHIAAPKLLTAANDAANSMRPPPMDGVTNNVVITQKDSQ